MQVFLSFGLVAAVQEEFDEFVLQTTCMAALQSVCYLLATVAQQVQVVDAEDFIVVQIRQNKSLVDGEQLAVGFGLVSSLVGGVHAEK